MKRCIVICVVLLCLTYMTGHGQDSLRFKKVVPAFGIKFSPFHLLNFYPTIQAGVEIGLAERFSLYAEGGYAIDLENTNESFLNKTGFKAKIEPRYYTAVNRRENGAWYLALELYHNTITFDRKDLRTECFDLDCQQVFQRRYFYQVRYRESGFGLKTGFILYLEKFFFDFNGGLALRFVDYDFPDFIREFDNDEVNAWFEVPNETDRTAVMPLMGIRVGYRIK